MANVYIYAEHREILDDLITSNKVASQLGATATGPFKEQRDAYVFAASMGMALGGPTPETSMPRSKKGAIDIRDNVFWGSKGARELAVTAVLLQSQGDRGTSDAGLRGQLEEIANESDAGPRLALLDRYAFAGFSWLKERKKDLSTTRDLVMEAIDKIASVEIGNGSPPAINDPLANLLFRD